MKYKSIGPSPMFFLAPWSSPGRVVNFHLHEFAPATPFIQSIIIPQSSYPLAPYVSKSLSALGKGVNIERASSYAKAAADTVRHKAKNCAIRMTIDS